MTPRERKYHFWRAIQRHVKKCNREAAKRKPLRAYVHELPDGTKVYTSRETMMASNYPLEPVK